MCHDTKDTKGTILVSKCGFLAYPHGSECIAYASHDPTKNGTPSKVVEFLHLKFCIHIREGMAECQYK